MDRRDHTLGDMLASSLDWWNEAGVDSDFSDVPHNWLAPPEPQDPLPGTQATPKQARVREMAPTLPPIGGPRDGWPGDLESFAAWWETSLDAPGRGPHVPPRGAAGAELMVLVPMPEESDTDRLLAGPQGALIANMLAAMGLAQEQAYLAAALPAHSRHPDWAELAARDLGAVLRHHAALAAPRRLLILGRKMLPLFGHDPAQSSHTVAQIALEGVDVPVLVAVGPEALLETPRFRRHLWQAWLDWTEEKP